jgi:hypothetical protein
MSFPPLANIPIAYTDIRLHRPSPAPNTMDCFDIIFDTSHGAFHSHVDQDDFLSSLLSARLEVFLYTLGALARHGTAAKLRVCTRVAYYSTVAELRMYACSVSPPACSWV